METWPILFGWILNYILKIREIYMPFYEEKEFTLSLLHF